VAYNGTPLAGARVGDSFDALGGGVNTRLVAGYNNSPAVAGNNSFALFTTADGSNYTSADIAVATNPPAAGDFKFGITFSDADTVIGKSGATGRVVDITGPAAGTLATSFTVANNTVNPMDFAIVGGRPILAVLEASAAAQALGQRLFVYDMTDPSAPVLMASKSNLPGASTANGNGVGQVRFGAISGVTAVIYGLSTNNGIQAFEFVVPEPGTAVLAAVCLAGRVRIRGRRAA
jgi:hypothetical protein